MVVFRKYFSDKTHWHFTNKHIDISQKMMKQSCPIILFQVDGFMKNTLWTVSLLWHWKCSVEECIKYKVYWAYNVFKHPCSQNCICYLQSNILSQCAVRNMKFLRTVFWIFWLYRMALLRKWNILKYLQGKRCFR